MLIPDPLASPAPGPAEERQRFPCPFYPLGSPGLPLPGPDFLAAAEALGDPPVKFVKGPDGAGAPKEGHGYGPQLQQLYYDALYQPVFSLNVSHKGRQVSTTFLRGHLWGFQASGPRPAKVMLVGKWPGYEEMAAGLNFVGSSGVLVANALRDLGVSNEEMAIWYVTNLIRHPNLDPSGNGLPVGWVKNCLPLLEEELRIVRPDIVLAMGSEAVKALIDPAARIDDIQGQAQTRRIPAHREGEPERFHKFRIMPCLHPDRVLRAADLLPALQATLGRFVKMLRGEEAAVEQVDHRVAWTERELAQIVDMVAAERDASAEAQIIAIDCEWQGDYPTEPGAWLRTIQFSHRPGFACCIPLRRQGGEYAFVPAEPCDSIEAAAVRQLRRLLFSADGSKVRIAGHHFRADLPWLIHGLDRDFGRDVLRAFTAAETPEGTRTEGGFDTMLAAHAVTEAPGKQGFKLEVLGLNVCGVARYDGDLLRWKAQFKPGELPGYGEVPDDVLHRYAMRDADTERRLVDAYNKPGGLLDSDQYGNNSRRPFWISMRAAPAVLEMEMTGLLIDKARGAELTDAFLAAKGDLTEKLRRLANWPNLNPGSDPQCRTLLFGPEAARVVDTKTGELRDVAPPGARTLRLTPIKATGTGKAWDRVVRDEETDVCRPSTDKETLGILLSRIRKEDPEAAEIVQTLRYTRFARQVLQTVLRPPEIADEDGDNEEPSYEKGLLSFVQADGRVRTRLFQTLETGRFSSSEPNCQNLGKKREKDYQSILGDRYVYPIRSVVKAPPGHALVEADYVGAELFMLAVQARDERMIDHCRRAALPDDDPNYYDIHSNVAVKAFKLDCAPTKKALEAAGYGHLRNTAKSISFGLPYGRGSAAIARSAEEEGVTLTVDEVDAVKDMIFSTYPQVPVYLENCKARVVHPGWMCNCFGRYRRFQRLNLDDGGDAERQALNYSIQSGIADTVSRALEHLHARSDRFRADGEPRYRLALQIHDAIMAEVRIEDLEWFVDEVLPWSMIQQVPIRSCNLDGRPLDDLKHLLAIETSVQLFWGVGITPETAERHGIPLRFAKRKK